VIYFKGSLRNATNTTAANNNNNSSSANFTFAGPYGWDHPTTYYITVTNSSSFTTIQAAPYDLPLSNQTTISLLDKTIELKLLVDNLESTLNKSAAILELTSKLPEVKSVPYN
jgi:hypothetical protein